MLFLWENMGTSTISMVMFNSKLLNYQRVSSDINHVSKNGIWKVAVPLAHVQRKQEQFGIRVLNKRLSGNGSFSVSPVCWLSLRYLESQQTVFSRRELLLDLFLASTSLATFFRRETQLLPPLACLLQRLYAWGAQKSHSPGWMSWVNGAEQDCEQIPRVYHHKTPQNVWRNHGTSCNMDINIELSSKQSWN